MEEGKQGKGRGGEGRGRWGEEGERGGERTGGPINSILQTFCIAPLSLLRMSVDRLILFVYAE